MEKKNEGLADAQEGEFILNESGTSVSIDPIEDVDISESGTEAKEELRTDKKQQESSE